MGLQQSPIPTSLNLVAANTKYTALIGPRILHKNDNNYSCPGLDWGKLPHFISQPIVGIMQNYSHTSRRNHDIQMLPNLVPDLVGGQYKNIDFCLVCSFVATTWLGKIQSNRRHRPPTNF